MQCCCTCIGELRAAGAGGAGLPTGRGHCGSASSGRVTQALQGAALTAPQVPGVGYPDQVK
jgi:hypothetical protein